MLIALVQIQSINEFLVDDREFEDGCDITCRCRIGWTAVSN